MTQTGEVRNNGSAIVKDGILEERKYGIIDRNYTPFWSKVLRRRGMYLAMVERRLRWRGKDVGAENDFIERPWLQLMCCAPVSGHEVGRIFQSEEVVKTEVLRSRVKELEWTR